jgi:hypothetical protein
VANKLFSARFEGVLFSSAANRDIGNPMDKDRESVHPPA